jgi:predicted RNase H-like nuclease
VAVQVAGVDGTKGGWVAVVLEEGQFAGDLLIKPVESSFEALRNTQVVAIDVPIGFGPRAADAEARMFLSGAASSVFATPPREVLARPYGPGLGISAQAHALGPRILHVTGLAKTDGRVREVHPEVSFRAMNNRQPLAYRKKSAGGALERIALLRRHGIEIDTLRETAIAPLDDVLDAAAAAWSADRIARGVAETLPSPPEPVDGMSICIWY